MDGNTTITIRKAGTTNHRRRIAQLVRDLEAEGFLIGMNRHDGYLVKMSEIPTPEIDAQMRLNMALNEDEELRAALLPWLRQNRPYHLWDQQLATVPRRRTA